MMDNGLDTNNKDMEANHNPPGTGGAARVASSHTLPPVGVFVSAVILFVALVSKGDPSKGDSYWAYGIALCAVAWFLALLQYGLAVKGEDAVGDSTQVYAFYLHHLQFSWCFVGACIMTFGDGPYTATSNGYFAAWGMAIFACLGIGNVSAETVRQGISALMGHLVAAIIVIIAVCSEGFSDWVGETIYGLILACFSVVIVLYEAQKDKTGGIPTQLKVPLFAVLALCWIVSASLMTFRGPFRVTGNGYFGSWGGAFTALYCAIAAYHATQE